jgi:hypothetical protein
MASWIKPSAEDMRLARERRLESWLYQALPLLGSSTVMASRILTNVRVSILPTTMNPAAIVRMIASELFMLVSGCAVRHRPW